ncbi:MAG: 7-cyano-7-deazaguanine synthase [Defluviitaleaceae bacterium]|nr:7-cyano-7-deazaguanine synthase [Defluviitaleaceae bacterium]
MQIILIMDCGSSYTKIIDRKIREMGVRTEIHPINTEKDKLPKASGIIISGGTSENSKKLSADIPTIQINSEAGLSDEALSKFVNDDCGIKDRYTIEDTIKTSVDHIKNQVGSNNVIVLLSGGVDSAVTAALLLKALDADNIYAIHVDHGFMRKNESATVCEGLKRLGLKHLKHINAKDAFFNRTIEFEGRTIGPMTELTNPEEKRNIIGTVFIHIVHETAKELGLDMDKTFIAQGTIRPDLVESGNSLVGYSGKVVKTHHNDVSIVRQAREKGLIVETNWDWYKGEVRQVGRILGLEQEVTEREPFPGPGLCVRLLCNDNTEELSNDEIKAFEKIMDESNISGKLLPLRSVGVRNECRIYGHLALFHGDTASFNWDETTKLSKKLTDQVETINRTAYILSDISPTNVQKLSCKPMNINDENTELLREIDHMVTNTISNSKISQTFCILIPIGIEKRYSIAIRTFVTDDFMTGRAGIIGEEISLDKLKTLAKEITDKFEEIEIVVYDVTGKPPGTCEWE